MILLAIWFYLASYAAGMFDAGRMVGPLTSADCATLKMVAERTDKRVARAPKYECVPIKMRGSQ